MKNEILKKHTDSLLPSYQLGELQIGRIEKAMDEYASLKAKEMAIGFVEWKYKNRWFYFENDKWYYTHEAGTIITKKEREKHYIKTTSELFDKYIGELNNKK